MQARPFIRTAVLLAGLSWSPAATQVARAQASPDRAPESDMEGVQLRGHVSDLISGLPLPAVAIRLVDREEPERAAWEGLSDSVGVFRTPRMPPATYDIAVEALGYAVLTHELTVSGYGTADLRIELAPEAVELEPIVVVTRRRSKLETSGFYERRLRGFGHTLTREEIEGSHALLVSDLMRSMPGVRVSPGTMGRGGLLMLRGGCVPDVILDGVRLSEPVYVDHLLSVSDIEGIEVYSGASSPLQYSHSSCGAVLAWTRDPGSAGGNPWSWTRVGAAFGFVVIGFLLAR